jgi:hypothetical protein
VQRRFTAFLIFVALAGVLTGGATAAARIVGGTPIQIEAAPWNVFVLNTGGSRHHQCGGTVIDAVHVVTAAHCLYRLDANVLADPDQVSIRAGVSKIGAPGAGSVTEQDRVVASFRIHPSYVNADPETPGDIAVLRLVEPLDLSGPAVKAASLPRENAPYPLKAVLTFAGYGQEKPGSSPSEQLASTTVTVDPQGYCGQLSEFRRIMYFNNGSEFCAASPTSAGCGGDSGGGLIANGATPVLIGVYSTGGPTCDVGGRWISVSVWTPENRRFTLGEDEPPLAPRPKYPGTNWILDWDRPPVVGDKLTCSTTGWPTPVKVSYAFSIANGNMLQSGSRNSYRVATTAVGKSLVCMVTVRNSGGATVETTNASPRIKPATTSKTTTAAAGRGADVATQYLLELSELHAKDISVQCVTQQKLNTLLPPTKSDPAPSGFARGHGKVIYLSTTHVCDPLARIQRQARTLDKDALEALVVVAREYGNTLGLQRGSVVECYAVHTTWKWVKRSALLSAATRSSARAYLLDNRHRPPEYALAATCAL